MSDGFAALLWLGVNALLATASYRAGRTMFRDSGPAVCAMASITVFLAVILLSTILLGAIGWLRAWILIGLVAVVAAIVLAVTARQEAAMPGNGRPRGRRTNPLIVALWGSLAAVGAAHTVMTGLLEFPIDFDSLMYHWPIVDQWIRAESLYAPHSSYWWTPGTSEVIGLWIVAPFSGDFLIALNNVPFMALCAVGSYCVAREIRLPRAWAHLTAMASILTYTALDELNDGQNDIAIDALFLTGAAFGLRFLNAPRKADLCFFAAAVGALCGVKYNALGYAALLIAAVVGLSIGYRGVRTAAASLAAAALGILVFSGYWYIRNWSVGGSPIFPMGLGRDIETAYPDVWSTTFLGNEDARVPALSAAALRLMTGPIHVAAVAAAPIILAYFLVKAIVFNRGRGRHAREALVSVFIAMMLYGTFVLLLITPFCLEDEPGSLNHLQWAYTPVRYGMCFLSSAVLVAGKFVFELWRFATGWTLWRRCMAALPGIRHLARRAGCRRTDLAPVTAGLGLIVWQFTLRIQHSWRQYVFADTGLVAMNVLMAGVILSLLLRSRSKAVRWSTGIVTCTLLACAISLLSPRWHEGYGPHFDKMFGSSIFTQASKGTPVWNDRIGVLELRAYPFFGSRRQTEVFRPRIVESPAALAAYVQTHELRFIATHTEQDRKYYLYANTFRWMQSNPRQYSLIHQRGSYAVFVVRRQ